MTLQAKKTRLNSLIAKSDRLAKFNQDPGSIAMRADVEAQASVLDEEIYQMELNA